MKFDKRTSLFLLLFLIITVFSSCREKMNTEYLAYKIKGKENSVFIVGSIHAGNPDFYPFPEQIENAFEMSENLVVEIDITSEENEAKAADIDKYAELENNLTIDKVISSETYGNLSDVLTNLGFPIEYLKTYKPWFIAIFIQSLQINAMGYSENEGVDLYFLNRAEDTKTVIELETFEQQMELFQSLDSEEFLSYTISSMALTESSTNELIQAWKNGDEEEMARIFKFDLENQLYETSEIREKMYTNRNKKMADKIEGFFIGDEDYFVVIGAAHLVGDDNIISLLKEKGFKAVRF